MTRSLLIFWLLGSLTLLSLFLCCLLSLLSHLNPPLQVGLCGRNGPRHCVASAAWHSASLVPAPPSRLAAAPSWSSIRDDGRPVLLKRVGQFVRTAAVAG